MSARGGCQYMLEEAASFCQRRLLVYARGGCQCLLEEAASFCQRRLQYQCLIVSARGGCQCLLEEAASAYQRLLLVSVRGCCQCLLVEAATCYQIYDFLLLDIYHNKDQLVLLSPYDHKLNINTNVLSTKHVNVQHFKVYFILNMFKHLFCICCRGISSGRSYNEFCQRIYFMEHVCKLIQSRIRRFIS